MDSSTTGQAGSPARGKADSLREDTDRAATSRQALLAVATRMFAEKGYVQTSMRDIAKAASLTTGALYGHFRNKSDLLAEAISARIVAEFGAGTTADLGNLDAREVLSDFVSNYARRRELRALIVQGAAAAQTDEATRVSLRAEQREHLDRWIAGYERERAFLGLDPSVDAEAAALFTWSAEIGLGVLEILGISPSPEGWAAVYDRLMRGLRLPPDA